MEGSAVSKMSKAIITGLVISLTCIAASIVMSGDLKLFLNWPSVFITIGGTTGVMVTAFPAHRLKGLGAVLRKAFKSDKYDIEKDIETILTLSELVKKKGMLALESEPKLYEDDDYLKRGITLMLDGTHEEDLRSSLDTETYFMQQRHLKGVAMVEMIASTTPALGLLGTYIGLIPMLTSLDDPTKLGPLMAIELVTSFYGSFLANLIFAPLAKRLRIMNGEEVSRREILLEGLVGILLRKNPRLMREELMCFVRTRQIKRGGLQRKLAGGRAA